MSIENKCKHCGKPLKRAKSNTCGGNCANAYQRLGCILAVNERSKEISKELNRGFSYDEASVLL